MPMLLMPTTESILAMLLSTLVIASIADTTMVATKTPVVITTSFIRQQIYLGIHDIMYQVSKQLVDIAKPMVHNEYHNANELDQCLSRARGSSTTSFTQG